MGWTVVAVVGFVVVTAAVTVMARSNTARWERDHRAAQAAARARAAAARSGWAAALGRGHPGPRSAHRPHLHLPHVHLPAGLVARLPHPHLHLPHPHLHVPRLHLPRRARTGGEPAQPTPQPPSPAGAAQDTTGAAP